MTTYDEYLPQLRTTTLFRDMTDEEILLVLNSMQPPIKKGRPEPEKDKNGIPKLTAFRMVLKSTPAREPAPRYFKYDMPAFGEPGMLMAEIPALSNMQDYVRPQGGPPGGPMGSRPEMDLETLEFTPEMITQFYSPESAPAQGKMLRNFLGILSQKVCDVRQELFLLRDGRDMYDGLTMPSEKVLHILTAGVAMNAVKRAVRIWNAMHPELPAECKGGGSVDLIHMVQDGTPCDVLIMADETIIDSMLIPGHASGYRIFAGNKMVIMGSEEHPLDQNSWKEKLLDPEATFGHFSPYGDPSGYRAVMAMLLSENIESGLAEKLMNHPGHRGMEKNPEPGKKQKPAMYNFGYYTMAKNRNVPFAELPDIMNLSDDSLADEYASVAFDIDEKNTVKGAPISHALTIPLQSKNKSAAKQFAALFLNTDFEEAGFIKKDQTVGEDPLA